MSYEVISRKQAHELGRKRFYTGRPCLNGHLAQRFVTTGGCVACNAARSKLFAMAKSNEVGKFVYPLHPDDHAAALAYCQALDMQRGRMPTRFDVAAPMPAIQAVAPAIPAHIAQHRADLVASLATPDDEPYLPKP